MVFEELARMEKSIAAGMRPPVKKAAVRQSPPPPVDNDEEALLANLEEEVAPQPQLPPIEKIDRNYSPMAAFGLKKQKLQPTAPTTVVAHRSGPPQKLVYFEKEGIGTVPAFFHDVIVAVSRTDTDSMEESGFIVLVYDLRFEQNAARWFPPSNDPYQRPWAAQINDDSRLYLVHTTGFQYVYDSREYCVLRVERAIQSHFDEA
jgi:hypothetical protein